MHIAIVNQVTVMIYYNTLTLRVNHTVRGIDVFTQTLALHMKIHLHFSHWPMIKILESCCLKLFLPREFELKLIEWIHK